MKTRCTWGLAGLGWMLGFADASLGQTAEYTELLDRRREFTNFNIETTRGIHLDFPNIYTLNTHGSHIVVDRNFDAIADDAFQTLNQPIAIDLWEDDTIDKLVVAGGGTHALAVHRADNGKIFGVVNLPSEPGDVVVHDALDKAYVACMGTNEVVEVDLNTFAITANFPIPSRRPRFLSLEVNSQDPNLYEVFVTPLASGNNTRADHKTRIGSTVLGFLPDDPSTAELEGLPDEDLFALRFTSSGVQVDAVAKGLGGVILDHGRNPATGEYWVLSIVPDNADPNKQDEPSLEHDFVTHALTILPDTTTLRHVDLDPGVQVVDLDAATPSQPCSFPFALLFDKDGNAAIAGSTSDRVAFYDSQGTWLANASLPPGSIPRDFEILQFGNVSFLFVYCWGTNKIEIINLNGDVNTSFATMNMGLDPTPDNVATGRAIWYDASRSDQGRSTCNSCHPGGGSDFIGWQLQDPFLDRKDVMVTQSLLSIEDTFPYHWRGERDLGDFNRLAFPGLLGGAALDTSPGGEFDVFREFVFSLQAPRNPTQSLERVLDDSLTDQERPNGLEGSAVLGQDEFLTVDSVGTQSCVDCHNLPHGTNGDISFDGRATDITTNLSMDVTHLRQLFSKEGGAVLVEVDGTPEVHPEFGFGLAHEGEFHDIFDFLGALVFSSLSDQEHANIASFVEQMDQGIAPAAQAAWYLSPNGSNDADIQMLLNQAALPEYLDAVVIGRLKDINGTEREVSWLFDPAAQKLLADDPELLLFSGSTAGEATMAELQTKVDNGANLVFLGVPPGNGRGFALDFDRDGLLNGEEATPNGTSEFVRDWDGDSLPDGYEVLHMSDPKVANAPPIESDAPGILFQAVDFISASSAQVQIRFDEPVSYDVHSYRVSDPLNVSTHRRLDFVTEDTFVLQSLTPSSPAQVQGGNLGVDVVYEYTVTATDLSGNQFVHGPFSLGTTTDGIENVSRRLQVADLTQVKVGPRIDVTVRVRPIHEDLAVDPNETSQLNRVAVFHVLKEVNGELVPTVSTDFQTSVGTRVANEYVLGQSTVDVYDGKLVLSPPTTLVPSGTFQDGVTTLQLRASPGTVLRLQLVGLFGETTFTTPPTFDQAESAWMMPSTPDDPVDRRGITLNF